MGEGTVAGGRLGLAIAPRLVEDLAANRQVALVSGTNGKTTTTRLLVVALEAGLRGAVTSNATGANMPAGHLAALAGGPRVGPVVLEVDEGYVSQLLKEVHPRAVVLLNLSRDQLDRTNEVRMLAGRWRTSLEGAVGAVVVANADDPLVVWGASRAPEVVWVAAGLRWRSDAVGCPACEGRITFHPAPTVGQDVKGQQTEDGWLSAGGPAGGWSCECGFARPVPSVWLEEVKGEESLAQVAAAAGPPASVHHGVDPSTVAAWSDGGRYLVELRLPGRFNRANAVMAAAAAGALGVRAEDALAAMQSVGDVAGRFTVRDVSGVQTRLLLAKNPAGWSELLSLVCPGSDPVVIGINARIADGHDPSWLWDVPFEQLAGRQVVATGDRCLDLAVRLRYAEIPHQTIPDPLAAVRATKSSDPARVEFIGNYTAFHDLLGQVA